jgi:PAS domain S-box-containing protein
MNPPPSSPAATGYGGAVICAAAALVLRLILQPLLGDAAFHVFPLAVAAASLWGLGPGLLATAVSALAGQALLHPQRPFAPATLWGDPRAILFVCEGVVLAGVIAFVRKSVRDLRAAAQELTERELRAAAEDMRAVLDSALDAVIGMDERGTVSFWNPRAAEIFGWSVAEAQGRNLAELVIRPADRDGFRQGLSQFAAGRESPWLGRRMELLGMRRDRSHFPVEICVVARRRGASWLFNAFVADITERKRNEELALTAEQEARRAAEDANRTKDEFLGMVSHELRTPLTAIVGWAHVLRSGGLSAEDMQRAVASIDRNARAQSQLISDLLDVTRIVSGKMRLELQTVDAAHVVEAAAETVQPSAAAKGVALDVKVQPGAAPVRGDPHRLQQVVWNLMANAVKFTDKGGSVRARVQRAGEEVEISVEDTGKGISPEFLPYVFERFQQAEGPADHSHGGLGLGLAIARHLTQLHGGSISAHSDGPGRGARFTLRLPALPPAPALGTAAGGAA